MKDGNQITYTPGQDSLAINEMIVNRQIAGIHDALERLKAGSATFHSTLLQEERKTRPGTIPPENSSR